MSNLENFLPKQDEPVFIVYWRGRKDKNCRGFWHSPGIMDGGYDVDYFVKDGNCRIAFSKDSFAGSFPIETKEFKIEKCKEYEIYIINKHIVVPGVELTTLWDEEIEQAENKRIEEQREQRRKEHPEEFFELPDGSFTPMLRMVRLSMPTLLGNKIFTEFNKENSNEEHTISECLNECKNS